MTGSEHESGRRAAEPDGRSPWRRGNADHASEIVVVQESLTHSEDGGSHPVAVDHQPGVATEAHDADRQRRWMAIGSVAGAVALGVGAISVLFFSGSSPERADDSVPPTVSVVETLPTVPADRDDEVLDETAEPDSSIGDATEDTLDSGSALVPLRVELPPVLADQTEPTEIVALTVDGQVVTISIPSGNVRTETLDFPDNRDPQFFLFNGGLVTSPSAAAVQATVGTVTIVGREGHVQIVTAESLGLEEGATPEIFPVGWVRDATGSEHFVLSAATVSGDRSTVLVDQSGNFSRLETGGETGPVDGGLGAQFANGVGYFDGGGLVFRFRAGEEISTVGAGDLLTVLDSGPVVRRCTSAADCVVEIVRSDGAEPIDPSFIDEILESFVPPSIAPDGRTLATATFDGDGVALFLTPLQADSRSSRRIAIGDFPRSSFGWISDSSGVVLQPATENGDGFTPSEPGVRFVPADPTIDEATFAPEIGRVVAIATRFPAAELPPQTLIETRLFDVTDAQRRLPALIVADRQGTVSRIDFGGGRVTDFRTGLMPLWSNGQPAQVIPLERSVVVIDADGVDGLEISGDQTDPPPAWPAGRRYRVDGQTVWAPIEAPDGATYYLLVDRLGEPVDGVVDSIPDESVLGSNGAGSLVREVAGDIFITDGADPIRLTTGELIALGVDEAIVHECGADLVCDVVRVDLVTGERRITDTSALGRLLVGATTRRQVALEGSLSPDGRTALVEIAAGRDSGPGWAFADLVTNDLVLVDTPDDHQPIIWSADSNSALFLSDGALHVFDRDLGTTDTVDGFRLVVTLGTDPGS